ncbi:sugar phosphate permease [Halobacteroides halobius DSM 5150]|uniref:Sugar phosphate permease n=1 Tax=Halobacteroides halobius (strain ATCC 35273 / DSM 5150 / MD-1) TaxID=748449 RepID=L0K9R9_HALHC|nr:OFA family MFS transporter [Halobacteroides halobius]AGB40833.1 sugar phosphate permease [Halobacteroides halobius DSM 5150]
MASIVESNNSKESKRWIYIPLGLIIFMCMGTVYSWSVFRKPLQEFFNVGATESGLPYMLFLVSYAIGMPIAGGYIDKYGPRIMTIIGGLFVSVGWLLSGFASSITVLSLTYGVIAGLGVGIAYGAPMAVAAKWFPDKEGLAVGLTLGGFGLSPFVTAPVANWLVTNYGPFATFKIIGIVFAIIITVLAIPLKFPENNLESSDDAESKRQNVNLSTKEMLKTSSFYGLWICYVIGTLIGLMAIGISSPVAEEIVNLDASTAAFLVSFFAIFNGVGRPIFGGLTDKLNPKKAALISYSLIILASILMLNAGPGDTILYSISFALFWLNLGGWLAIAPTATGSFFGPKNYSKNYGFLFTAYGVGAILGGLLSGKIRDVLGSYIYVFYPTIGFAIVGIIVAMFMLKKPTTEK